MGEHPACERPDLGRPGREGAGITGLDHVDLNVRNRSELATFFVETLGTDVLGEGSDHTFLLFGDQVLGLRDAEGGDELSRVHHIALRLERPERVRAWLDARGANVSGEKDRDDSRSFFLQAPGGLDVELIHRPDPHRHAPHRPPTL